MNLRICVALGLALVMMEQSAIATSEEDLQIKNAWVRAMPPTQRMTAGYLEISNLGRRAVEISGARSELAEQTEIHTSREIDGYVRMEQLDRITVNSGETISLSPGGMHLMLFGMEKMPALGTQADICLILSSGSEICAPATVRKSSAGVQSKHH